MIMKKTKMLSVGAILVVVLVGVEGEDSLACCPPLHYITPNNTCWDPNSNTTVPYRFGTTCVDTFRISKFSVKNEKVEIQMSEFHVESFDSSVICTGNRTKNKNLTQVKPVAVLCTLDNNEEEKINLDAVLGPCMITSVIFLAVTAFIYSLFKELRDLFGKSVINFCISLAIGLGILSIMKLMQYTAMAMCATRGFLAYFFLLASFFWANSISIQVLRDTRRVCVADYGWREFRWYMLYSWGVPTILTVCMAIVNFHPGDHQKPGIGLNHCWFFTKTQQWYYMYSVMTILIIVNIFIFIYISTMVWRHSFSSSHIQALKYKLSMTIRLFVVMGVPWIFEMISSLSNAHIIWTILDVFNTLQGILIFLLLVVFRKRVIKVIYKRGWLDCCSGLVDKYLAVGEDAEANVIQHTDVPMSEDHHNNTR